MLSVTIAHIHCHRRPPPSPALDLGWEKMLLLSWASFLARGAASPRPLCSGGLSPPGWTMASFVPAPDPAARALKMGLAGGSGFFLISMFKGMRGVGRRGEAPVTCPGDRGTGGRMCWCGSGWALHHQPCRNGPWQGQAGATPEPCARLECDMFFRCPGHRDGAGRCWRGCLDAADLGVTPQRYRSTSWPGDLLMSREMQGLGLKKGTGVMCVLTGSSCLRPRDRACPLVPPRPRPVLASPGSWSISSHRDVTVQELGTHQDVRDDEMGRDVTRGHHRTNRPLKDTVVGVRCGRNGSLMLPSSPRTALLPSPLHVPSQSTDMGRVGCTAVSEHLLASVWGK